MEQAKREGRGVILVSIPSGTIKILGGHGSTGL